MNSISRQEDKKMIAKIFYRNGNVGVYSGAVAFNRDDGKKIFTITLEKNTSTKFLKIPFEDLRSLYMLSERGDEKLYSEIFD